MIWWIIATICAFFVKGLCGFANTLVFTTILSFGNNNINISPVDLFLGYPTNIIMAWRERKSIKWSLCMPLVVLVMIGSIPGIFFLKNADTSFIKILFGFVIIFIGLEMLLREFQSKKSKQSRIILVIIGILSGLLCGLYGIGALLGAYINKNNKPKHFMNSVKKRGALLAKGRLLGIQFDTLFTNDLYFEISRHAIDMAEQLKNVFKTKNIKFYPESPTNQQFIILENEKIEKLSDFLERN